MDEALLSSTAGAEKGGSSRVYHIMRRILEPSNWCSLFDSFNGSGTDTDAAPDSEGDVYFLRFSGAMLDRMSTIFLETTAATLMVVPCISIL